MNELIEDLLADLLAVLLAIHLVLFLDLIAYLFVDLPVQYWNLAGEGLGKAKMVSDFLAVRVDLN